MMILKVINKNAIRLHCCEIICFKPDINIKIKKINGLKELLVNKNYEPYKDFIKNKI
jgi:hypothetical protein